jgi:hypothetical protein
MSEKLYRIATILSKASDENVELEEKDSLRPETEFSCQIEFTIIADFEGRSSKEKLINKIKSELKASIETGLTNVSRELDLQSTNAVVRPMRVECAVNDMMDVDDDAEFESLDEELEDDD